MKILARRRVGSAGLMRHLEVLESSAVELDREISPSAAHWNHLFCPQTVTLFLGIDEKSIDENFSFAFLDLIDRKHSIPMAVAFLNHSRLNLSTFWIISGMSGFHLLSKS